MSHTVFDTDRVNQQGLAERMRGAVVFEKRGVCSEGGCGGREDCEKLHGRRQTDAGSPDMRVVPGAVGPRHVGDALGFGQAAT